MTEGSTPLMRQYSAIKKEHPSALLFFRLGDFYEMFFDDAVLAAKELQITLTSRNKEKGIAVPMCGVPFHAAEGYISKLIRKGYKVAICDQVEDPRVAKKLVRREVTRVVTPETAPGSPPSTFRPANSGPPSSPAKALTGVFRMNCSNCVRRNCSMHLQRRCLRNWQMEARASRPCKHPGQAPMSPHGLQRNPPGHLRR